jgi:uncharacterized protein YutE (UPF0331/DUF86 family)
LHQGDKSKLIPYVDYLEKELQFLFGYEREVDWKVYESQRSRRLEVERWVESLINAILDISKILISAMGKEVPEISREVLFRLGSYINDQEEETETFSELPR